MNRQDGRESDPNRWAIIKLEEGNSVYNPTCGISIVDSKTVGHSRTKDLQPILSSISKRLRLSSWVWIPFLYVMGIILAFLFWKSELPHKPRDNEDPKERPTADTDRRHTNIRRDVSDEQDGEDDSQERRDLPQETYTWYNNDIYHYDPDTNWPNQESKADKYCV